MKEGISVFPNPAKDKVVLTINDYDPPEKSSRTLLDAKGYEILSQRITPGKSEMGVSKLEAGVYYCKVL